MAYCSWADIQTRLPTLPDADSVEVTESLESQVSAAIQEGDTEVDGALASLFSVPFSPVPPVITSAASYLAAAFMLDSGWSHGADATKLSLHYRALAQDKLDRILAGKLVVYPSDPTDPSTDLFGVEVEGDDGILSNFNPYAV